MNKNMLKKTMEKRKRKRKNYPTPKRIKESNTKSNTCNKTIIGFHNIHKQLIVSSQTNANCGRKQNKHILAQNGS